MTAEEFIIWLKGCDAMIDSAPSARQWNEIIEKVNEVKTGAKQYVASIPSPPSLGPVARPFNIELQSGGMTKSWIENDSK